MALLQFDVTGEQVSNDETEEVIRKAEPYRDLIRYRPDGSGLFVRVRVNMALLRAAASLPILLLKLTPRANEVTPRDALLTPRGSSRNYAFLERLCEDLVTANCPVCYIAEQHEGARRPDDHGADQDAVGFGDCPISPTRGRLAASALRSLQQCLLPIGLACPLIVHRLSPINDDRIPG